MIDRDHHPHSNTDPGLRATDQLAKEARAMEARMLPEIGPLTDQQLHHVSTAFSDYLAERGVEAADVAKQIGKPMVSVLAIAEGRFDRNDAHNTARACYRWLRQMQDSDREGAAATYITTAVAEKMIGVLRGTHQVGMMGVIVGPSGISKSTVFRAAEAGLIPASVHIELTMPHGRPAPLARLIAKRTRCHRKKGSLAEMLDALIDHLRDTRRLLMIDEAHYLSEAGCQVLRDLHKQTGVPIVLGGTRDVLDTISDFHEFAGQFKRLIAYTLNVTDELAETGDPLYTTSEVQRFAKSMGLRLVGGALTDATRLACLLGWGGLGSLRALLLNARLLVEQPASGPVAIDQASLHDALRMMEGATGMERVRLRAEQQQKPKAAVA